MKPRLFIDSSVLFSAANSERGHSRDLVLMSARGELVLVVSHYVLEETRRNLARLREPKDTQLELLLAEAEVEVVNVERDDILRSAEKVALKDAPIIAAAKKGKSECAGFIRQETYPWSSETGSLYQSTYLDAQRCISKNQINLIW